jgi:hypothetical protein
MSIKSVFVGQSSNLRTFRLGFLVGLLLVPLSGWAQQTEWPQEITAEAGSVIVYQPQPESFKANILTGRAAVSLKFKNKEDLVFGAIWFTSRVDTDGGEDLVTVRDIKITRASWPNSTDANEQQLTAVVENAFPESGLQISKERLSASLATAALEQKSLDNLKSDPPKILFSEELAVLLAYDGVPKFGDVENSDYERVLNTAFAVARNKKTGRLYLSSGSAWYEAADPMGPWALTKSPPADLVKMVPKPDSDQPATAAPIKIFTATEPTELISSTGAPEWKSVAGGKILYVKNTETAWLRVLDTNNIYVLLSGRWFRAKAQTGPWTFVRSDELPESFSQIPPESDIGGVRVSVSGTEEAEEAMQDAAIPQTAAIKRSEASLKVEYDGNPKFEKISGTDVAYAVNTGAQVLKIDDQYYAVDDGVWFTAKAATGPWIVADSIPTEAIQQISPSSPAYNTTYVHIFESTPEVVHVGYYPGYRWSFPYYGVPIYGTGWYYPPYWGGVYYPRPPTWGMHVGYNPWTGWNFGVSWSNGFFNAGIGWSGGAYRPWGCCGRGYRGPTIINTGDINIGNNINIGNRTKIANKLGKDNPLRAGNNNLYNRSENKARKVSSAALQGDRAKARHATGRLNNVYADKSGNVARRVGDSWESRSDGAWKSNLASANARDTAANRMRSSARHTRPSSSSIDHSDLNRHHRARQMGTSRQRSRSMSRGGGRSRGGGGRRR